VRRIPASTPPFPISLPPAYITIYDAWAIPLDAHNDVCVSSSSSSIAIRFSLASVQLSVEERW